MPNLQPPFDLVNTFCFKSVQNKHQKLRSTSLLGNFKYLLNYLDNESKRCLSQNGSFGYI